MTGTEFESWIKRLGLNKSELANVFCVNRDTITARCKAEDVESVYAYALLGLAAQRGLSELQAISECVGTTPRKLPRKPAQHS